jgi:nitrite reductase (NADH) small subunit
MEFTELAGAAELPVGRMKRFTVDDRNITVAHTKDGYFALDNTCPHRGGPLSEGDVIGNEIVCPWHLWGFDAATGICIGNPEIRVSTHEVKLEDGRLMVKLSPRR